MNNFSIWLFDSFYKIEVAARYQEMRGTWVEIGLMFFILFFVNWVYSTTIYNLVVNSYEEFCDKIDNIEWKHVLIALSSSIVVLVTKSNFSALVYSMLITLLIWQSIFDSRFWMIPDILFHMLFALGAVWAIMDVFPLESLIAAIMTYIFFKLLQIAFRGRFGTGDIFALTALALVFGFDIYQIVLLTGCLGVIRFSIVAIRKSPKTMEALVPTITAATIFQIFGIGERLTNVILSIVG